MKITLYSIFTIALLLAIGCSTPKQHNNSINGVWKSIGYGKILEISDKKYRLFDITSISCTPFKKGNLSDFLPKYSVKNDTLTYQFGFEKYQYQRIDKLPQVCSLTSNKSKDPVYNFDVFATTFKENYEYFKLNNIDYEAFYKKHRSRINKNTSNAELYLVFEEMLSELHDNHGSIEPDEKVYEEPEKLQSSKEEIEEEQNNLKEYGDFGIANIVATNHLQKNLTKKSWLVSWGKFNDTIGYIQVKAMFLHADIQISDSLKKEKGIVDAYVETLNKLNEEEKVNAEISGIAKDLDIAFTDLSNTKSLILDIRFNGGGDDHVSLEILRRFNPKKIKVATKKAKNGNGYSSKVPIYLDASTNPYTKPVYILSSQQSASATDFLLLASLELKNIKRIGSRSNGAVSDALPKKLPNGWDFTLSNESYIDNKGKNYENIGISPNIELNYPLDRQTFFRSVADNLQKDKNDILKAIEELSK